MPGTVSEIFDFLDTHPSLSTERHEVSMAAFGVLRRNVRLIVVSLREEGDHEACEISDRLRNSLSEWLTVPVRFDGAILAALQTIGCPNEVEARWGRDVRIAFDSALRAAHDVQLMENPVRERIRAVIRELDATNRTFKIYCHRTSRACFESLFMLPEEGLLGDATFLHSVRDYRDSNPFDTLIKIGPLRSWGWSSAPDAIKAAPRFGTLVQIVWAGCADEPGFGYDPVAPPANDTAVSATDGTLGTRISWTPRITRFGNDTGATNGYDHEEDEFQIFARLNQPGQKRRAALVRIHDEQGILYPPRSRILSFDPALDSSVPVGHRFPGETLLPGMFIIVPQYDDLDMGSSQCRAGTFSSVWKERLSKRYQSDPGELVEKLNGGGIRLLNLHASVGRWCRTSSGVLPAPGDRRHFQILVQVLGVESDAGDSAGYEGGAWWQSAWNEIRHARGEAIQTGRQEHQIIDEELLEILNALLPAIRCEAAKKEAFQCPIPANRGLRGAFSFYKILSVEDGFLAPDLELNVIRELNTINQWRA
jgi:hypothetical protein